MQENLEAEVRKRLRDAKRVIIKIGTRVLTDEKGRPEELRIKHLVSQIASLHNSGMEVLLVSSGSIGRGLEVLGFEKRPTLLPDLQMAAAVGQVQLMSMYKDLFSELGINVAQVLLTHGDLQNRKRHLNARNTLGRLFENRVLPIVNENDVVSVDEIKVGDNDQLASLSALLIDADTLVLLSTVEGFLKPTENGERKRVSYLERIDSNELQFAGETESAISTGGMNTKLQAAQIAVDAGKLSLIADGRESRILEAIFSGEDKGTLIGTLDSASIIPSAKKRWLAVFTKANGSLKLDSGAVVAVKEQGKSLLAAGIQVVSEDFERGDLVNLEDSSGAIFAKGLVDYSSKELSKIKGLKSSEIESVLGECFYDEVIHRDNLVVLEASIRENESNG